MLRSPSILPILALALALGACKPGPSEPAAEAGPPSTPPAIDQPGQDVPPATAPAVPSSNDGAARYDGYGPLRFGMNAEAVRTAWDGALNDTPEASPGCYHLYPIQSDPSHLAFMMEGDKFIRYDVRNDQDVAPGGGKVGMATAQIEALYPERVTTSPHKYVDGQYLRIQGADGVGVLVFETDADGKVSQWRAGQPPAVDYVEGCS